MNKIAISSVFVLTVLIAGMAVVPSAFADHPKATVSLPKGSGVPGCEVDDKCYIPSVVTVDVGGEVHWSNDDSAAHTVTSGTPENGPDGVFDSSLFMAGNSFTHKFASEGTFDYFCMVHPWMVGQVIVQAAGEEKPKEDMKPKGMTEVKGMSKDGSINVKIMSGTPTANERLSVDVTFTDKSGKALSHVNYDITATQDGKQVLNDMGAHQHEGKGAHMTAPLGSDKPVDINVTLKGLGLPGEEAKWTGPKGEIVTFQVVPEFGTIAMMILGVAIVSIVALSAKSKIMPRI